MANSNKNAVPINIADIFGITVTPEVLHQKADSIKSELSKMQSNFDNVKDKVTGMKNYWKGDASDSYQATYKEYIPEIDEIMRRLEEHVRDMHQIANKYSETEKSVEEIGRSLSGNVIF